MRQLIRFHHWLLMACVVLALGVALSYSVRKLNKTAREHEGFLEKYDLLEEGMTEKEVAAILGPHTPDPLFEYPGGSLGEHNCFWYRGKDTIYVCFYSSVSGKRFEWGIIEKAFVTNGKEVQRTTYGHWPDGIRFSE